MTHLNLKIVQMGQQTQSLEEKLRVKTQENRLLKKKAQLNSRNQSVQGSENLKSARSVSSRTVVVAREKGTQTPMSFLSAK